MTTPIDSAAVAEASAYGRGLLLDDGDLVLSAGALVTISGTANLQQGLLLRIATPWANDRLNTAYGLDATDVFTGGLSRSLAKEVLRLNLIRTVAGDPRVSAVDEVLFDDDPAYLADHPETAGGSDRRVALVQITVQPVPPAPIAAASATGTTGIGSVISAGSSSAVTILADVRW